VISTLNDFSPTIPVCPALPNQNALFLSLPEKLISDIAHFQNGKLISLDETFETLKPKLGYYYAHTYFLRKIQILPFPISRTSRKAGSFFPTRLLKL